MDFRVERATSEDGDLFVEIINKVWEEMEEKEWFAADVPEYTRNVLKEGRGIGYKAIEEESGDVAGVFMVMIPGESQDNLGYDLGMPVTDLQKSAHMESIAIISKYRGNHLQYRMMQEAERYLREQGFHYLMCTIHPDNTFSLNNALRQGYEIMMTKEKYGGYLRHILLKKI